MALAASNITMTAIKTALGDATFALSTLAKSANVNMNAFYSPVTINLNTGSKCFVCAADTCPHDQGDFRCYEHTANTPCVNLTNNLTFGGSPASCCVLNPIFHYEFNLKALNSACVVTDVVTKLYVDNTCAVLLSTNCKAISFSANTPPTGHKKNQTLRATNCTMMCICVPTPASYAGCTLYADTYMTDGVGSYCVRYPTFESNIFICQLPDPCVTLFPCLPYPTGWCSAFPVKDQDNHTSGSCVWSFTAKMMGNCGTGTAEICADVDLCYNYLSTDYLICCNVNFYGGFVCISAAISPTHALAYSDDCSIYGQINTIYGFV